MSNLPQDNYIDEEDEVLNNTVPPRDIFAFNELRSCADLKRMADKKQIDLQPDFQRSDEVWSLAHQTRFLDSLLKNLPIPSMCISQNLNNGNQRIVIDGLQRISTIVKFLSACDDKSKDFVLAKSEDIDERLFGKKVSEIAEYHPEVVEVIENVTIPITVLRSDFDKSNHMEYIFTIFQRLNTGSVKLNAQEIRNCIFSGNFNGMLSDISKEYQKELDKLSGSRNNTRLKYDEFVLRFFAFQEDFDRYQEPLARFLNNYMKDKRNLSEEELKEKREFITNALNIFSEKLLNSIEESISRTLGEAILYGIGKNIDFLKNQKDNFFVDVYQKLKSDSAFQGDNVRSSTTRIAKMTERFSVAENAFSGR